MFNRNGIGVRPALWIGTIALLGGVAPVAAAGAAHAATVITCAGADGLHYAPGLTFTAQNGVAVSASDTYTDCPSAGLSASTSVTGTLDGASCLSVGVLQQYTETITWSGGNGTSTIDWRVGEPVRTSDTLVVVLTGTVTGGRYVGFAATKTVTDVEDPATLLACASPGGLTYISGSATLELVGG